MHVSFQGILHLRGRPTVAYDNQVLVFAVAMEVGGDTAEICDIKFSNNGKSMLLTTTRNNVYILDAYNWEKKGGFNTGSSQNATIEATFSPDGQYVFSGSGDGCIHGWNLEDPAKKVASLDSCIGVPTCLKWAPKGSSNPVRHL